MMDPLPSLNRLTARLLVCAGLTLGLCQAAQAGTLYVAPNGDDAADGSPDHPLRTIEAALGRDAAASIKLKAGTYALTQAITLGPQNSGVVISADGSGPVILSGGSALQPRDGAQSLIEAPWTGPRVSRLWVKGEPAPIATVPSTNWHYITERVAAPKSGGAANGQASRAVFRPEAADQAMLAALSPQERQAIRVVIWHSWETSRHGIASLADNPADGVTLTSPAAWAFFRSGPVQRYQLENVPIALAKAGSWSQSQPGLIDYKPKAAQPVAPGDLVVGALPQLLVIEGANNVTVSNIQFAYSADPTGVGDYGSSQAASTISAAIVVAHASAVTFDHISVVHTGGYGLWLRAGSDNAVVEDSTFSDLGAGGIRVGDTDNPGLDEGVGGVTLRNNIIKGGGRVYPAAVGILIGGAHDTTVDHNTISDLFYTGISVGWKWSYGPSPAYNNHITSNLIHQIGQGRLADMGGIYTLGESPGTVVADNVIYDVYGYEHYGAGAWGLYADQASTGITFERNLVAWTTSGGFHQNFGKNNIVRNNVFAFGRRGAISLNKAEPDLSLTFTNNAVLADGAPFFDGPWASAKAELSGNMYFDVKGTPTGFAGLPFAQWQGAGRDLTSRIADPGFINPAQGDFALSKTAAWSWGAASPVDQAGAPNSTANAASIKDSYPAMPALPSRSGSSSAASASPATEINDDFEAAPVGSVPGNAVVTDASHGGKIVISDSGAAGGKHSVEIDGGGPPKARVSPYLYYQPNFSSGLVVMSFAYKGEAKACMVTEWRDGSTPYLTGPRLVIWNNQILVADKPIMDVPSDTWITIKIAETLGSPDHAWHLEVDGAAAAPSSFTFANTSPTWTNLAWLGFISACTKNGRFYLDDIHVNEARP